MKKVFITGLIGLFPFLLIAQQVALNNKTTGKAPAPVATITNVASSETTNNTAKSAKAVRKEARETRHFEKTTKAFSQDFANASDVQWTTGKNEYVASFTKDGAQNRVWFSKGGSILYSMLTYGADKLPSREQNIIHNEFKEYKITSVDEVHENNITVYLVHLENDRNIKLVTVCDGDTNIYQAYKKM